ncbi:hypothetical protein ACTOV4_01025 [Brucella sp. C7-11G]
MTPSELNSWLLPVALLLSMLFGASMIGASVRNGWLTRSIVWASVVYVSVGALLLLSPRWTTIAFEYKDFKAQIAELETEKTNLSQTVSSLESQIAAVSELGMLRNVTAKQAVAQIDRTRNLVDWAGFLPALNSGIKVAVQPNDQMMREVSSDLNVPAEDIIKILNSKNYTLLTNASDAELSKLPPSSLWFNTTER